MLVGSQGIGKDLCFLKFAADILGEESVHKISKMGQYKEKFNGWKEKCRLCVFSDTGDAQSQNDHEMIKADLDALAITCIRNMYTQQKMVKCSVGFMFSANHLGGNVISSQERRFFATGCSNYDHIDKYVKDHKLYDRSEYFKKMAGIDPVTMAYYLYTRDLSKFNIMDMPATETLLKLKERSLEKLNVVGDFVSQLANNTLHNSVPVDGSTTYSSRKYFTLDSKELEKILKEEITKKKNELLVKTKGVPIREFEAKALGEDMKQEIANWRHDKKTLKKLEDFIKFPMQHTYGEFESDIPRDKFNSCMRFAPMTAYQFHQRFVAFNEKKRGQWASYQSPNALQSVIALGKEIRTFLGMPSDDPYFGKPKRCRQKDGGKPLPDGKTTPKRPERIQVPDLFTLSKIYIAGMTKQANKGQEKVVIPPPRDYDEDDKGSPNEPNY